MTLASLVAPRDHDPPGDIVNFEMNTEAPLPAAVRDGGQSQIRHRGQTLCQVEIASESQQVATRLETSPHAIRLAVPRR
jgi:hypothetical protein